MAPFPDNKITLLERLVSNGDLVGIGAATAKKRWPSEFTTRTLNKKIRNVRQNVEHPNRSKVRICKKNYCSQNANTSLDADHIACLNRMEGGISLTGNFKDTHEQDSLP